MCKIVHNWYNQVLLSITFCFNHFLEAREDIRKKIFFFLIIWRQEKNSSEINWPLKPTEWPPEDDLDNENILFPIINTIWLTLVVAEFYPVGPSLPFPIEEEEHQLQELQ